MRVVERRAVAVQGEPAGSGRRGRRHPPSSVGSRATRRRAARGREADLDAGAGARVEQDRVDRRPPVVLPVHRRDEGLAAEGRERAGHAARSHPEQNAEPFAAGADDQVAVAGVLDGADRRASGHQRVLRRRLERTLGRVSARDADAVAALGAALGDHEVPGAVDLVEVRRLGELPSGARPQRPRLLERDVVVEVDLHLQDAEVRAEVGPAQDEAGVGDVDVAVGIPRDVGIDAVDAARCRRR